MYVNTASDGLQWELLSVKSTMDININGMLASLRFHNC